VPLSDILIVYDDFSLPLGVTRLRMKGSSGGHNGLNSIIEELKTAEFPRLKLGIGPVPEESIAKEFVLTDFAENEKAIIDKMFSGAITIVEKFILS
ncbi:MAG: peptidyl-tRNA hydrolase, partial [Elusimicrobia bacterium CG_4_10_14_0_8_um_filter_37_32]